jgi:hypothetical protein
LQFRKELAKSSVVVRPVHIHIGCFMDRGEFSGFLGMWDKDTQTFLHWGDPEAAELDLATWEDASRERERVTPADFLPAAWRGGGVRGYTVESMATQSNQWQRGQLNGHTVKSTATQSSQ